MITLFGLLHDKLCAYASTAYADIGTRCLQGPGKWHKWMNGRHCGETGSQRAHLELHSITISSNYSRQARFLGESLNNTYFQVKFEMQLASLELCLTFRHNFVPLSRTFYPLHSCNFSSDISLRMIKSQPVFFLPFCGNETLPEVLTAQVSFYMQ